MTPYVGIVLFGVAAAALLIPRDPTVLLGLFGFEAMLAFIATHLSVIAQRVRERALARPFVVPFDIRFRGALLPLPAVAGAAATAFIWVFIRDTFFSVVSLASTTGFVTADYEKWQPLAQYILFMLLFMGRCAGSTAGAMKAIRVLLFAKQAVHESFETVRAYAVSTPRINGNPVTRDMMRSVSAFIGLYLLVYVVSVSIVSLTGMNFPTALSAVPTAMGSVGPGLADVGPYDSFLWVHPLAKLVLTFDTRARRLELVTLMIIFTLAHWRR